MPYLLLQILTDFLALVLCMSIFTHTDYKWTTRASSTSRGRKTLILHFEWSGPGAPCVAMKMSQWTYHRILIVTIVTIVQSFSSIQKSLQRCSLFCDFVSTMWPQKSSNLHKSKSLITPQPRVFSQWNNTNFLSSFWKRFWIN